MEFYELSAHLRSILKTGQLLPIQLEVREPLFLSSLKRHTRTISSTPMTTEKKNKRTTKTNRSDALIVIWFSRFTLAIFSPCAYHSNRLVNIGRNRAMERTETRTASKRLFTYSIASGAWVIAILSLPYSSSNTPLVDFYDSQAISMVPTAVKVQRIAKPSIIHIFER